MNLPECRKNTPYIADFIEICFSIKLLDLAKIREMYVDQGLTTPQIARHFGVSKSSIVARLHGMGIREGSIVRTTNPENYRQRVPPYGYCIRAGKLVLNKAEIRICRTVVELVQRQGKNHTEVARELSRLKYKNRGGRTEWNSGTVFNIYKRWKNKI